MATIPEVINNGYISSYKAALYNAKQSLFSGGALAAPNSTVKILMVTDGLSWGYDGDAQTDQALVSVANYLIWISGKFYLEATAITGSGGGSVVPVPPGGLSPNRIDFYVSSTSLIPTNGNSYTFSQFIGYNLDFYRSGALQTPITSESSYFTFNKTTGAFFASPDAIEGELWTLIPT